MSEATPAASVPPKLTERLVSLDAYRGTVMLLMASGGLGIAAVARELPDSSAWQSAAWQVEHVPWIGCSLWDLIQPSFMFLVGVSMVFSYRKRQERRQSYLGMLGHAAVRAAILILLGVFLRSDHADSTQYTFVDVLAQIGLGYVPLFLLWGRPPGVQLAAALLILVGYWSLFALYPLPADDFDYASVGVADDWEHLSGFGAHWDKNTNPAAAADRWLLNQFPREKPFEFNRGGYATLNFIPSLATMIFGLLAGGLLASDRSRLHKLLVLVMSGLAMLAIGWALGLLGVCPVVKRIWTPSWAIYSTGWCLVLLALFYGMIDMAGTRWWYFPMIVVGMNSIAIYVMAHTINKWIARTLQTHFGQGLFELAGQTYQPMLKQSLVLLVMWLFCFYLYRQRIFFRV
jgi:heparan-alpha-glucosaminide N-acetyltransferase